MEGEYSNSTRLHLTHLHTLLALFCSSGQPERAKPSRNKHTYVTPVKLTDKAVSADSAPSMLNELNNPTTISMVISSPRVCINTVIHMDNISIYR